MTHHLSEDDWEQLALEVLGELMWRPVHGSTIAPGSGERESWDELVIPSRLRAALRDLNPSVPREYLEQALAEILAPTSQDAITENHRLHTFLTEGFRGITYIDADGNEQTPTIRLVSTEPSENDWLAVNQVTIAHGDVERRFDLVLYRNGHAGRARSSSRRPAAPQADVAAAHAQLQTYLREFPHGVPLRVFIARLRRDPRQVRHPVHAAQPLRPVERRRRRPARRRSAHLQDGEAVTALETALVGRLQPGAVPAAAAQLHRVRRGRRTACPSGSPSRTSTSP